MALRPGLLDDIETAVAALRKSDLASDFAASTISLLITETTRDDIVQAIYAYQRAVRALYEPEQQLIRMLTESLAALKAEASQRR